MTDVTEAPAKKVPWYTLNPAAVGRSRLIRALAVGLVIVSFSLVPLWRLCWYFPLYGFTNFVPKRDAGGHFRAAWQWIDSQEIRIYQAPDVPAGKAEEIARGVQAMVDEIHLNFTVKVLPIPPKVLAAYQDCTEATGSGLNKHKVLDFGKFESALISLRQGDPHADMLVVTTPLKGALYWWAHGIATFTSGVAVLESDHVNFHLGKHETGHLLGYQFHDSLPLFVVGYPWEGWPWSRDTLMMLYSPSNDLSPRNRDALHYFWRGMERRSGKKFLKD
ncbi:MAG: hypothetical protein ACYDBB_06145 [Armatimonadota bacterium]